MSGTLIPSSIPALLCRISSSCSLTDTFEVMSSMMELFLELSAWLQDDDFLDMEDLRDILCMEGAGEFTRL